MTLDLSDRRGAAPEVVFGPGRRPEAATQVRLESFDGPLALLLALIEARQLDVVSVPLGALAGAAAAGRAGARPPDGPPLDPIVLIRALDGLARIAPPPPAIPETVARAITLTERAEIIRAALRGAGTVVLQDLLAGVRDRVV